MQMNGISVPVFRLQQGPGYAFCIASCIRSFSFFCVFFLWQRIPADPENMQK
jgi:hypothetical protein